MNCKKDTSESLIAFAGACHTSFDGLNGDNCLQTDRHTEEPESDCTTATSDNNSILGFVGGSVQVLVEMKEAMEEAHGALHFEDFLDSMTCYLLLF